MQLTEILIFLPVEIWIVATMTTTVTNPGINIATNMIVTSTNIANTPTTNEISKFSIYIATYM